ncbi:MAG: chlorite dismutase family protein [Candidatus Bathyarchaeia archaeon]
MNRVNSANLDSGTEKYLDFVFYQVEPAWRRLSVEEKKNGIDEFIANIKSHVDRVEVRAYSTIGIREDADFLLWTISRGIPDIQDFLSDAFKTGLGKYLRIAYSFLSMKKPSIYTGAHPQTFEMNLSPLRYLIVYPFVKSREWYLLPFEERKKMMEAHRAVGQKFPSVRLNTTYAFGLSDQDFVLAFETDSPTDFQTLIMQLRESEASRYTVKDTPMMFCVFRELEEILLSLGL